MIRKISFFIIIGLLLTFVLPQISFPVSAADEKIVVVLDAGHGGMDGGTSVGIRTEKEYDLILAQYIADALTANGNFEVILTRSDDTYLKFLPRALVALDNNADILISLHCNSSDIPSANGILTLVSKIGPFNASALAGKILDSVSTAVDLKRGNVETRADTGDSLGVYYWNSEKQWDMPGASQLGETSDYFSINTWASKFGIPSIIVEHGYLSNEHDRELMDKDENLRAIANAEAQAIIDFYTGHVHQFGTYAEVDHPSNCTLTGTQSWRCTVCGMKTSTSDLEAAPDAHYWRQTSRKDATCTEDGFVEYICQISENLNSKGYACDVHTYTETLPAKGHSYQTTEDTPAAHGRDGRLVQKCANCGDVIEEIRPGDPHQYTVTSDTEPTCTEDGGTTYTCAVCSDAYTEVKSAAGHDFVETERKDITGKENGYIKSVCTRCGEEREEILHACEHQYENRTETPATCTEDGRITETCVLCGYVREETLPSPGHDLVVSMDVPATCTSEGYYRAECKVCGHKIMETRAALGHAYRTADDAEYNKEENATHIRKICTRCGADIVEEIPRRNLRTILQNPVLVVIFSIILIQLITIPVIVIHHTRHQNKLRKNRLRTARYYEEDAVKSSSEFTTKK